MIHSSAWQVGIVSLLLSACFLLLKRTGISRQKSVDTQVEISSTFVPSGKETEATSSKDSANDAYGDIEPLPDFDWKVTEPIQYRSYKPKYHMTMGLENRTVSELIEMDKYYLDRIALRKQLMRDHLSTVMDGEDVAKEAIDELYSWLVTTYLPTRFPTMFEITMNPATSQMELFNKTTSEHSPLSPNPSLIETLQVLGSIVEDDFVFLLPAEDDGSYEVKAFLSCFPNLFSAPDILNKKLRQIHTPVPKYKERLEFSMDRWFSKLEIGRFALRCNWTITPYDQLFTPDSTSPDKYEIDKTYMRTERQVLHRLPRSKAIVFSIKQYIYPLKAIKEEGSGPALAEAIDGLRKGNAPEIHTYKRADEWSETVKAFLTT